MANRRNRTIPLVHPTLVPRQSTMAGNVLVVGVVAILEATCLCQDMRPGIDLVPTMGLTVGVDREHQTAK